ncbi:MAG: P-II family nitrogen regulator [Pelotomaculaceae bacterium]|jgi:nitrogen regulatory protein P-II 1|uniref:Nitrogen regulatory protein P-II n=1 Tax=anaerobic digester metagenome TaxID=1263854 RepID=A0A485M9S3_9ZZZZ|nr:P-II family nitrogen regulator [Bacillota bacterium]HHU86002.1 P-II family nitrogen regulator [Peptococcaceae bacterium]
MKIGRDYQLIVTIIKKGFAERVVNAAKAAGARGGTILHGRGVGIHEQKKLLGIPIEPEKDIILTLIHQDQTKNVLKAIVQAGQLEKPGTGIGFVIDVDKVVGIVSLLEEFNDEI